MHVKAKNDFMGCACHIVHNIACKVAMPFPKYMVLMLEIYALGPCINYVTLKRGGGGGGGVSAV